MKYENGFGHWATIKEITDTDGTIWYELKIDDGHSLSTSFSKTKEEAENRLYKLICWKVTE